MEVFGKEEKKDTLVAERRQGAICSGAGTGMMASEQEN